MSLVSEFRSFVQRGNVVDMAVGVIVGGAFGKIASSLVSDVLMPPIGLAVGGVSFADLRIVLGGTASAPVALNYGGFLQAIVDFLIVALCVFLVVRTVNAVKRPDAAPVPGPTQETRLLAEIRDLLRERR